MIRINVNLIWYSILLLYMAGEASYRWYFYADSWGAQEVRRSTYDISHGLLSTILITAIISIVFRKQWGLSFLRMINQFLTLLLSGIVVSSAIEQLHNCTIIETLKLNTGFIILIIGSLAFWILLSSPKTENAYSKRLDVDSKK